jgi:WD40 repeat protein
VRCTAGQFRRSMNDLLPRLGGVILALVLIFFPTDILAAKRAALIIANANYISGKLNNPLNDAALIKDRLEQLNFSVKSYQDVSNAREVLKIVHDFADSLDDDTIALFYYAGHGIQVRQNNLLVTTVARLTGESSLPSETFPLDAVVSLFESRAQTSLLFWDACRNNPLATRFYRGRSDIPVGAARVDGRSGNTFIVLSAAPGKVALDGAGDNSPFAAALARHIMTPDIEVQEMLTRVTGDVLQITKGKQRPERSSQLSQAFYFNPQRSEVKAYEEELKRQRAIYREAERPPADLPQPFIIGPAPKRNLPPGETGPQEPNRAGAASERVAIGPIPQDTSTEQPSVTRSILFKPGAGSSVELNLSNTTVIRRIRIAPNGRSMAVGGDDGIIRIISLETFAVTKGFQAHKGRISDLDFTPDSRRLLSTGRDGSAYLWDVDTGRKIRELLKDSKSILYSGRINPNFSDRFALFGGNGYLYAEDLKRNKVITKAKFHSGPVMVAYQPKGKGTYLSAGGDGLLKIRLPEGQRVSVKAHNGRIFEAGYNVAGDLAYTAGYDRLIKLWEVKNGYVAQAPKHVLEGHLKYVLAASMSPSGKTLISGGGDKAVNVWSVDPGKLVARLIGHTSDVEAVAITADNKFAISSSEDKSLRLWSIDNKQQLLSIYFRNGNDKYVGVTFDKQIFGDEDSKLVTIRIDGKEISSERTKEYDRYIGREISISSY